MRYNRTITKQEAHENTDANMLETDMGYVRLFQSEESVESLKALNIGEHDWYLLLAGARNALSGDGFSLDFNDLQEQRVLAKCIRYNTLCEDPIYDPTSYQAGKDLVDEFPDGTGSVEDNILLDDYYFTSYIDECLKNLD